jgi:hypothetical protein
LLTAQRVYGERDSTCFERDGESRESHADESSSRSGRLSEWRRFSTWGASLSRCRVAHGLSRFRSAPECLTCEPSVGFPTKTLAAGFSAYLESSCTARAHNCEGSRSLCLANSIISLATAIVAGSLRSTNPSLRNAASNAADNFAMSSGANE